jgi:hypothetical protein
VFSRILSSSWVKASVRSGSVVMTSRAVVARVYEDRQDGIGRSAGQRRELRPQAVECRVDVAGAGEVGRKLRERLDERRTDDDADGDDDRKDRDDGPAAARPRGFTWSRLSTTGRSM